MKYKKSCYTIYILSINISCILKQNCLTFSSRARLESCDLFDCTANQWSSLMFLVNNDSLALLQSDTGSIKTVSSCVTETQISLLT